MNLKCGKCQTEIAIPAEVLQSAEPRVQCPSCGMRYRLKPRGGSGTTGSTPALDGRATTPLPPAGPEAATVISTGGLSSGAIAGRLRFGGPIFAAGDLVAQRYRIVRFLAQGGMGEVYQAEDVELRQEVALKTVSAHIGGDPAAIDRFKREISLARRVTHPNVCRIFDLGQHQLAPLEDGSALPPLTFLTMELLRGETLSHLLRRRGRLSVEEALPLIGQMAAALDAAHRAQIVHRDFKSENVFLVDEAEAGGTAAGGTAAGGTAAGGTAAGGTAAGGTAAGGTAAALGAPGGLGKRAVVTDFGVARGADQSDRFAAQVTGLGIVGTPAYMAPEQVENKEITPAADLYALGIVVYEMVTGRLPFESPNPLTTAVKRLKEDPPPPHVHVPDLPAYWEKAILRCLERQPADRFASPLELVQALQKPARPAERRAPAAAAVKAASPPAAPAKPAPARPATAKPAGARPARLLWVLAAVVLISAGLAAFNYLKKEKGRGAVQLRRSVAVFGLDNLTRRDDAAWISTALAETLSTELARGASLRTISGQEITDARRELQLEKLAEPSRGDLEKLRGRLGADYVVAGSYLALDAAAGSQLRVDLHLLDAASGAKVASFSEDGALGELIPIVGRLGDRLRQSLGESLGGSLDSTEESGDGGLPKDPEAGRLYAEALDALRAAQPLEARQLLEQAAAAENDNPLIHLALSAAWQALGYKGKSADEARKAFELATRLPREEKLLIEGRWREAEGNAAAARDIYRTLYEAFPDNLDYGLSLIAAERSAGSAQAALETVDALRRLPPPLADDVRLDLAEADAAAQGGFYERQRTAAEKAVARARAQGARLQLARALLQQAQSQRILGKGEPAAAAAQEAAALFAELDHTAGRAQAANVLATCLLGAGQVEAAAAAAELAAGLYREVGDQGGLGASLNNLAIARKRRGELDRVEALYGETEQIYRQTGDRRGLALAVNNQAVLLVERDRLAEARVMFESSRPVWEEIAGKIGGALSTFNLAQVARFEGRLEEARKLHQQALDDRRAAGLRPEIAASLAQLSGVLLEAGQLAAAEPLLAEAKKLSDELGDRSLRATVLAQLGELALQRKSFGDARRHLEQSLADRQAGGEALLVAGTKLALARLALAEGGSAEGDPAEAGRLAREALEDDTTGGRRAEEVRAAALLALALVQAGDAAEARQLLLPRRELAAATEQPHPRLLFGLAEERAAAADPQAALPRLAALAAEARRHLYLPLALEIELAWVEAAESAGRGAEAEARRQAARAEAQSKGLLLLESRFAR